MNYCKTFIEDGKCSNCGSEVRDTDKYCHECGKRLHPIEKKGEEEARHQRDFEIFRRWLGGTETNRLAADFRMSQSNVADIVGYRMARKQFQEMPYDIQERIEEMLGHEVRYNERVYSVMDGLKKARER